MWPTIVISRLWKLYTVPAQCMHAENNAAGKLYLLCAPGATGVNQEAFFTGRSTATHTHVET